MGRGREGERLFLSPGLAGFLSSSLVFLLCRAPGFFFFFFFLVVRCQNVVNGPRERERTPFPSPRFGPGPGCYNVTMEEEILPCSRIYTYCDITGMPCAGACWEMKWFSSNVLFSGSSLFTLSRSTRAQFDSIYTKMFLFNSINWNLRLTFLLLLMCLVKAGVSMATKWLCKSVISLHICPVKGKK